MIAVIFAVAASIVLVRACWIGLDLLSTFSKRKLDMATLQDLKATIATQTTAAGELTSTVAELTTTIANHVVIDTTEDITAVSANTDAMNAAKAAVAAANTAVQNLA
jgi:peroxiredoxin